MGRWIRRILLYAVFLLILGGGLIAGVYYAGFRLPVYSDVAAFALRNWNDTGEVDMEADYGASLVRRDGRIHITVDLALPETVRRLRAYMDGGRTLILRCGGQQVYLHHLQDADLAVENPVISLSGTVELEMAGLVEVREPRQVATSVRLGHDRTTLWADVTSLAIEGLPDPLVEPILQRLARQSYTREQVLDLAAGGLSPELSELLAQHREALDLAFEDMVAGQEGADVTLQAVFSIYEGAAFGLVQDRFAAAGSAAMTEVAALWVTPAAAQSLGPIGDVLDQMGGSEARQILEENLVGDIARQLAGLTDCQTAF